MKYLSIEATKLNVSKAYFGKYPTATMETNFNETKIETKPVGKVATEKVKEKKEKKIEPVLCKSYLQASDHEQATVDVRRFEIGIDEAGRGPLFGRVYVAGVVLPFDCHETINEGGLGEKQGFKYEWMKDSKKFYSRDKRKAVAKYIQENATAYHVAFVEAEEIDRINILQAVFKGMHECVGEIVKQLAVENGIEKGGQELWKQGSGIFLLVDGNQFDPPMIWNDDIKLYDIPDFMTVEGGDGKYCSIAAASILAKVAHDEYIEQMCMDWPILNERYGLLKGMGYATKAHLDGIRKYGITQWHRRTFGEACKGAVVNIIG